MPENTITKVLIRSVAVFDYITSVSAVIFDKIDFMKNIPLFSIAAGFNLTNAVVLIILNMQ